MIDIAQLLRNQPAPPGVLLRGSPVAADREEHLLRQVIALANADLAGPRCLVFGVEHGAGGAHAVTGLGDGDVARLRAQREACVAAIEPALEVTVMTGEFMGNVIAALVLGDCRDTPYVAGERAPAPLRPGECWLFDAQGMRPATRGDLDAMYATRRQRRGEIVLVGVGDDPRCECLELAVPDASNPPSRMAALKLKAALAAKKTAMTVMGREDTAMGRLAHARIYGPDVPFREQGMDTLSRSLETLEDDYRAADLHYYFELRAVRLNLAVMNAGTQMVRNAVIEVRLPDVPGLTVAPRFYGPSGEAAATRYPEVRCSGGSVSIRAVLGDLAPECRTAVFGTALRLRVGRPLLGHKVAIRYALAAQNLSSAVAGRLRIKLVR